MIPDVVIHVKVWYLCLEVAAWKNSLCSSLNRLDDKLVPVCLACQGIKPYSITELPVDVPGDNCYWWRCYYLSNEQVTLPSLRVMCRKF